ncbi:unnamed protein product [Phytophthora lilii]|uniref:Unnamed protein product n=1 Tax=Phytophthora lilii TaxID=2077276 RepID=A0A9W6WNG1_9STRA|nr:unnamed protein product [Phytophthora lilii]
MAFNVGGTIREVCQGFCGVGVALLYNYVLFAFIEVERFDSQAEDPYKNYYKIERAFNSSSPYWVNIPNLAATLPWIVVFTIAVMVLPFHLNTRKYAVGTNAYFSKLSSYFARQSTKLTNMAYDCVLAFVQL